MLAEQQNLCEGKLFAKMCLVKTKTSYKGREAYDEFEFCTAENQMSRKEMSMKGNPLISQLLSLNLPMINVSSVKYFK